jgi:hypothetical protein
MLTELDEVLIENCQGSDPHIRHLVETQFLETPQELLLKVSFIEHLVTHPRVPGNYNKTLPPHYDCLWLNLFEIENARMWSSKLFLS